MRFRVHRGYVFASFDTMEEIETYMINYLTNNFGNYCHSYEKIFDMVDDDDYVRVVVYKYNTGYTETFVIFDMGD